MKRIFLAACITVALVGCSKSDEELITHNSQCSGWIAGLVQMGYIALPMHYSEVFHNEALALVEKMDEPKEAMLRSVQVGYDREEASKWAKNNLPQAEEKIQDVCEVDLSVYG